MLTRAGLHDIRKMFHPRSGTDTRDSEHQPRRRILPAYCSGYLSPSRSRWIDIGTKAQKNKPSRSRIMPEKYAARASGSSYLEGQPASPCGPQLQRRERERDGPIRPTQTTAPIGPEESSGTPAAGKGGLRPRSNGWSSFSLCIREKKAYVNQNGTRRRAVNWTQPSRTVTAPGAASFR